MPEPPSMIPPAAVATPPPGRSPGTLLERFTYDDAIVRKFLFATLLWAVVAMLAGLFIALQLAVPSLSFGSEYLTFGRLRPIHTNAAIFAFAGNAIFAAIYYSTQRLCKARMWSDLLGRIHFWGWQAIIVSAAVTLPLGITSSKEYAELEWPIDIAIALVWVAFAVNFFGTLAVRRERHLYVAIWFYIATIVTVAILHIFNSLALPVSLTKSYSLYAGVQDAFMQWWYGHNAVAFFLTTPFLGLMYYFIPKAANRPVFSYRLSIVHFWSLVFLYIWAGPHHLHYTALPEWASTLGMIFSVMLWMPSWGGMINGLLTLRGAWHKVVSDPVLKFFVVGVTFYGMSTFEGPLLSVKSVNALSHYTDWTIGHVHAGALGWNGFMAFGMMYWLLPRLCQAPLYSRRLAEAHFWLATLGILAYVVAMYFGGITQGLMWRAIDEQGRLVYPDFVETVMQLIPFYWIRAAGGAMYIVGLVLGVVNYAMTWAARPARYAEEVHEAPPLARDYRDAPSPPSRIQGHVADFAHKLDVVQQAAWHRRWERLPLRFTVWTTVAVVVASLFEIVPTFLIRSNVPTIATVTPYTPLELAGRDIYIAEGCNNCHSQMIRPLLAETKRYGDYSKPGEFVYDRPFLWGSKRTGPDLARVGGSRSPAWHVLHFQDPRQINADSIMPEYAHLLRKPTDYAGIPPRVRAMHTLGAPYSEAERRDAETLARQQAREIGTKIVEGQGPAGLDDMQVVALIAYLDRLGVDLFKTPATESPPAEARSAEEPRATSRENSGTAPETDATPAVGAGRVSAATPERGG
ncbi:MAG: cytochrome-c oxidase, cbb3-type subunit I [Phycisphaerales bacterium]|nr:cytochrome-c oxidase, cbb3-type subunit I [Phycisphaerales bacterium]